MSKKITQLWSVDGRMFKTREEAEEYANKYDVQAWTLGGTECCLQDDESSWIYVENKEKAGNLISSGVQIQKEPGIYYYDKSRCHWIKVPDVVMKAAGLDV